MSYAQLVPIDEQELSDMTGQAFINVDRLQTAKNADNQMIDTTKITLGLDIKTSLNADLLELGKYDRSGEAVGSADIRITDFALGYIDGEAELVPFEIEDPFIELAFEENGGNQDLIGVRLGFGGARGKLSGNIESLTGNIDVNVYGTGSTIAPNMDCAWYDALCGAAKTLVGGTWANSQFQAKSSLIDGDGESDPVRATQIGILNGDSLSLPDSSTFENIIVGFLTSDACELSGTPTCFPLTNFKSLDIGSDGEMSSGMFLSFQTKTVVWDDNGTPTSALEGAFMNIPNGGINVSFTEAFEGIERVRTKYVDPYYGGN
jgi:hypothetical protein